MTDLCADHHSSADAASIQIRASRSDLSIENSSPRLEPNATTSSACLNDGQPLRRDLSSELLCPLCDQLFDRPVMVTCGHSYCEPCIERHTRDTRSCVICKHDVGPFEAMIPSITLDNMVRKIKNQDNIETSYDDLFICEEKEKEQLRFQPKEEHKVCRTMSQRSQRRLFFSIAAPMICSSPVTPHRRRPLPASARPTKSSLKLPPESLNYSIDASTSPSPPYDDDEKHLKSNDDTVVAGNLFRRNGFGRRSERYTASTQAKSTSFDEEMNETAERSKLGGNESTDGKLKRNSFLRRSLNAIRSRTGARRSFIGVGANSFLNTQIPEEEEMLVNEKHEDSGAIPKTKHAKSLWRRLFMPKKSKISEKVPASTNPAVQLISHEKRLDISTASITFVRLENQHDDPEHQENLLSGNYALGYYTGIGRKFERVANGSEITLVVFGHAQAGKTSLVRGIRQLFLDGDGKIRVIPIAERYKLAGIGVMPYPEGDNRLPHIVSLVIHASEDEEYVLDIIDPEYDNSNLPQAYMDACDAAVFLIDARNCASLLSAHQIQRNLKSAEHSHVQCEMIMNIPSEESGQSRMLSAQVCETTMSRKAPIREMCVNRLDKTVIEEMLISICQRVRSSRMPSLMAISSPTSPTSSI